MVVFLDGCWPGSRGRVAGGRRCSVRGMRQPGGEMLFWYCTTTWRRTGGGKLRRDGETELIEALKTATGRRF